MSLPWPGVIPYFIQTWEGCTLKTCSYCSAKTKQPASFQTTSRTSPVPQTREKTDGGRRQISDTAVCSRTHRGTSQQLMAPRTLAGKQGDFKVVATPCSLSRWQLTPQRAARRGYVGGRTNPSSCSSPRRAQHLCNTSSSRMGRHRAMHPALLHAVVSRGSHLQRCSWVPKSPRSYSEILHSSPPGEPTFVFSHTFDHSCLEFKESHSSAKPDDKEADLKGLFWAYMNTPISPSIKCKLRRLTPISNLQRGAGDHLSNVDKENQQMVLLLHIGTEMKQQSCSQNSEKAASQHSK